MGKLVLSFLIFSTLGVALFQPWVGVLAYYIIALWDPVSIWTWVFENLRVSYYVALATMIGFVVSLALRRLDFSALREKQNLYVAILWTALIVSYHFNPYGLNESGDSAVNSALILDHMNKVFLFYFISIFLIDSTKKLYYLIVIFLLTVIYHTYWANDQYLSGLMTTERLSGPGFGGLYTDENAYAMLFVMGIPFLYFMGSYYNKKWLKYALWLVIPFAWHAIFLTGSRGALVGLAIISLVIGFRSRSKTIGMVVLAGMIAAFVWQGGDYLKEKSHTIVEYEGEGSAEGRLQAWSAALKMMGDYPLAGVGVGNFIVAFSDYSKEKKRVTHNTFFQWAAESGVPAGLAYIALNLGVFLQYFRLRDRKRLREIDPLLFSAWEATACGLSGFFVCSLFLNLATYETFYYLLILNLVTKRLAHEQELRYMIAFSQQQLPNEYSLPGA